MSTVLTRRAEVWPLRLSIGAVVGAQVLLGAGATVAGAVCAAILLIGLLNAGLASGRLLDEAGTGPARTDPVGEALAALALVPLLALLEACSPFARSSFAHGQTVAVASAAAVAFVMKPAPVWTLLAAMRPSRIQALVAACGVPAGIAAAGLLVPAPVAPSPVALGAAVAVSGALGALSEVVFRGVVQTALARALSSRGVAAAALLSAGAAGAAGGWVWAVVAGGLGLALGWCVHRTGSLLGAVGAHALLNVAFTVTGWRGWS